MCIEEIYFTIPQESPSLSNSQKHNNKPLECTKLSPHQVVTWCQEDGQHIRKGVPVKGGTIDLQLRMVTGWHGMDHLAVADSRVAPSKPMPIRSLVQIDVISCFRFAMKIKCMLCICQYSISHLNFKYIISSSSQLRMQQGNLLQREGVPIKERQWIFK